MQLPLYKIVVARDFIASSCDCGQDTVHGQGNVKQGK